MIKTIKSVELSEEVDTLHKKDKNSGESPSTASTGTPSKLSRDNKKEECCDRRMFKAVKSSQKASLFFSTTQKRKYDKISGTSSKHMIQQM